MAETGFVIDRVSFAYGEKQALDDLRLAIVPGRFYGLVGPNGCGKSTLLDLLMANRRPAAGRIEYNGRCLRQYGRRELARQLALVPQEFTIHFAFTVLEVVLMGRHPYLPRFGAATGDDLAIAHQAMAAIGIGDFADRYVTELSGGEKQRVVVARALAQETPVLMLDEATSNLDVGHTMEIFNVARQRVRERGETVIAVVHNLDLAAAYCDELIFLKEGRVAACGPTRETLTPAVIEEVFGVASRVSHDDFSNALQVSFRYGG
ncbi:MAG: ABC transporter ATP-binding protein [Desulfobulbaceae bacterium]|nr:ABC transporter ATP-binding protein [Desulfobulbaceae bacterium]